MQLPQWSYNKKKQNYIIYLIASLSKLKLGFCFEFEKEKKKEEEEEAYLSFHLDQ